MLRLRTLGGLSVESNGQPPSGAGVQRRRLALLALLARAGARGLSRDKILAFLWPETESEKARHALTNALYALRRDLREEKLFIEGAELRLNPQVITSDVAEFVAAIEAREYERAAALYEGPFLDGVFVSDAPEFERWVEQERADLAHAAETTFETLARSARQRGDHRGAVQWWRRVVTMNPTRGDAAVGYMEALAAAGDRAGALQFARVHELRMQEEFEIPPDPAVSAYVAALRAGTLPSETPRQPPVTSDVPAPITTSEASVERPRRRLTRRTWTAVTIAAAMLVVAAALRNREREFSRRVPPANPAIVVLPFTDLSPDRDQQHFADGIAEELTTALAQVHGLRVVAQTSAMALRDAKLDVREIGQRLGVTNVLEGSVRTDRDRHRVTVQLIDVATGYHRWAKGYEYRTRDVFAIQDSITRSVLNELSVGLASASEPARAERLRDPEAYTLYLRGQFFYAKRTEDALNAALRYFKQAVERDPGFAPAHAGVAQTLNGLAVGLRAPRALRRQARHAALQALALDSTLADAITTLATLENHDGMDFVESERLFRRAIALAPGYARAHHGLGNLLGRVGKPDEAQRELEIAHALDPLSLQVENALALRLLANGHDSAAFAHWTAILEMDPNFIPARRRLAIGYMTRRRIDDAIRILEATVSLRSAGTREQALLARAYAVAGRRDQARRVLRELVANAEPQYVAPYYLAAVHAALGENSVALDYLARAVAERDALLENIYDDGFFESLYENERFERIVAGVAVRPALAAR